jgi:hypothetical protein
MPRFTYTGTEYRYYPANGVEARPGVTAEFAELPEDGLWVAETAVTPPAKTETAVTAPAAGKVETAVAKDVPSVS